MLSFEFYYHHLEKVSRSFSFCIKELQSPAKQWVALSYLLFRVIDIIEDSCWQDKKSQLCSFKQFKLFLKNSPSANEFLCWLSCFSDQLSEAEQKLLTDLPLLLLEINKLPQQIQQDLIKTINQMIDGMIHFINLDHKKGIKGFESLVQTNQYCFFVAGIVGELLSRIFTYVISNFKLTSTLINQSIHFGLFLQKINILKDQYEDELVGRYYIFSRCDLRNSLVINAQESIKYLISIPIISGRSYRLFCAWSLFIGLASLKWIDKSWEKQENYKISRRETNYILNQINLIIDDNNALEVLFKRYLSGENNINIFKHDNVQYKFLPTWFNDIYHDPLYEINYSKLGVIEI